MYINLFKCVCIYVAAGYIHIVFLIVIAGHTRNKTGLGKRPKR